MTDWKKLHGEHFRGVRCLVTGGAGFIGSHVVEALSALGALLGAVLSYSALKSAGNLGNGTAVAAIALLAAPLVIALIAISVWSHAAAFSAPLALGGFLAGTGIAGLTGLIHYSNNPRMYFIVVSVTAGLGLGVASTCLRRELRTMLIAIGLGALGGLVAGALTPIPVFTHRGAWTAAQTLAGVIGAAPLCVLIAFLPRASRVAPVVPNELDPSAAREPPVIS